jgi:hypothetical protein
MLKIVAGAAIAIATNSSGSRALSTPTGNNQASNTILADSTNTGRVMQLTVTPAHVISAAISPDDAMLPSDLRAFGRLAKLQLQNRFGADLVFVREFIDPEASTAEPEYFLVVSTLKEPTEAMRLLDEFIDSWWLGHDDTNGRLNVTIEYPV